ncbi:MAG: CRTAC1 family protein, partial [Holophagales bacterium]|nr:CRTAC1 family protein [Holophagales bacterium]
EGGKRGPLRFVDVTEASGIDARGYGMGAAAADVDNDGFPDLYITNYGANELWRNRGDGTFENVTVRAGVGDERWSVPAAFLDLDLDGWLDLYVGNYLDVRLDRHKPCFAQSGAPDYCGPTSYEPQLDRFYRNLGGAGKGLRFADRTVEAGVAGGSGPALGLATGDFDGDGALDLYVANDETPNLLWMRRRGPSGEARFENEALFAGAAVNSDGLAESSMGLDAGDVDGDGDEDLFMAHLTQQTNTLYVNDGSGFFEDGSDASGLGMPSWPFTGFGAKLLDYDNDGRLDVLVVNGAVKTVEALARAGDPFPLGQTDQLFRNLGPAPASKAGAGGGVRFEDVTEQAGPALAVVAVSRGLAVGDLDNDGDPDAVIFDNNGPTRVLLSQVGSGRSWIGVEAWDGELRREAFGARVGARLDGRAPLWRRVRAEGSYATSNDPRLIFGLGDGKGSVEVTVEWPGGPAERFEGLEMGRYHRLVRGEGKPPETTAPAPAEGPGGGGL